MYRQYVQKACPSGVPPIQCIEGATADQPYAARTLKRQSQLRYRQLPTSVRVHNYYEMRKAAIVAAHGCSHEEGRVIQYPAMASAYVLGQAEASKACVRYFDPAGPAEVAMKRSVENLYKKAVNPSGVFSTACTDGQAKYEAYLMQLRGKSAEFRAKQYSVGEREAMKYAARKQALSAKGHDCSAEEVIFSKFPIVASAMRPSMFFSFSFCHSFLLVSFSLFVGCCPKRFSDSSFFICLSLFVRCAIAMGYYPPYVKAPTQGYTLGVARPPLSPMSLSGVTERKAAILNFITKTPSRMPM